MTLSFTNRRGSALLIVLGMLSFMLFSGLAFSVYMRYSRLPTSFLRRTATTRQLAKAALAEAIDDIDCAIGNDPHPGVPSGLRASGLQNIWTHRVFVGDRTAGSSSGSGGTTETDSSGAYTPALVGVADTVPTLTLEGLAYLPPNLINEARYYSQLTPTAKWHSFWFDSGRYAYTAIDVSDYFDVNRLLADKPRAGSASRRISFAHLFEDGSASEPHSSAGSGASKWDSFMDKYRTVDQNTDEITYKQYPFVSMADFNIAWGAQDLGGLKCPFYGFIKNGTPYDCGESEDDPEAEKYRCMTFVTDGWFPKTAAKNGQPRYSLEDPRYQPFKFDNLKKGSCKFPEIDEMADTGAWRYGDKNALKWLIGNQGGLRLNIPNLVALWDYLDEDSIPASLCVPTVERTPMICGLRPSIDGEIDFALKQTPAKGDTAGDVLVESKRQIGSQFWDVYSREITYTLDLSNLTAAFGDVRVLMAYPFRDHGYESPYVDTTWKLDGRASVFLSMGEMTARVNADNFTAFPTKGTFANANVVDGSLVSFPLKGQGNVTAENFKSANPDAPCALDQLRFEQNAPSDAQLVLVKVKYRWARDLWPMKDGKPAGTPMLQNKDPEVGTPGLEVESVSDGTLFPLATTGQRADKGGAWGNFKNGKLADATALKLNLAVWARLTNANGDTVDLVPACHIDDENMNDSQTSKCTRECGGGDTYPLMHVAALGDLQISKSSLINTGVPPSLGKVKFPDVKWIISDPRYNYAPENWVQKLNGGALAISDWADDTEIKTQISTGDGDPYMATSDAGMLQSVYELAFLPRVSNGLTESLRGNAFFGNLSTTFNGQHPASHTGAKDAGCMWKTYSPFGRYSQDEFSDIEDVFETAGMKVNPYSDSAKVLMAAFANTPHDWRVAATNNDELFDMKSATFNKKHAWNAYSTDQQGKLCWNCLEDLAATFSGKARSSGNWEDAFAQLGWDCGKRRLVNGMEDLDGDDSDLYSVDKKFLYGFWRDCFAARQQLFLIFVRAEPMMMGGGVKGQVPPQLGAHAVALVWRDPIATTGTRTLGGQSLANPHRTRILFYHQFD